MDETKTTGLTSGLLAGLLDLSRLDYIDWTD